jgi:phenylacetate-coenzyme A ligase PaaK-like adenylate-forming protein
LGGAVECSARSGYHLREADLFFEIIHPDTGEPVRDGEYGEIVFSTLTRRGMPLIRYRTGDRSRFLTEPCPCGSVLKRMERIAGRINEALYLKDGSSFSIATLVEILLRDPLIAAYEAEMCVRNNRDCLVLKVHAVQGAADARRVYSELSQHSSFGTPIKEGFLVLDVREGNVEFYTSGTSKRFIADKRRT